MSKLKKTLKITSQGANLLVLGALVAINIQVGLNDGTTNSAKLFGVDMVTVIAEAMQCTLPLGAPCDPGGECKCAAGLMCIDGFCLEECSSCADCFGWGGTCATVVTPYYCGMMSNFQRCYRP